MLPVLYTPMPSDGIAVLPRAHDPAADEIAHLLARLLARLRPLQVIAAHHLQLRPRLLASDAFWVSDYRDPALLDAAMPPLLLRLMRLALDRLVVHRRAQAVHDVVSQVLLVFLHRQGVI